MPAELTAAAPLEPLHFRIQIKHDVAIGPGKAQILALIHETGSMAETGRRMGMSYQRIWTLVNAMNQHFTEPLVSKQRGGGSHGGATLTPTGHEVLRLYRQVQAEAERAIAPHLQRLHALIKPDPIAEPGAASPAGESDDEGDSPTFPPAPPTP